jgi:hypothetical protein
MRFQKEVTCSVCSYQHGHTRQHDAQSAIITSVAGGLENMADIHEASYSSRSLSACGSLQLTSTLRTHCIAPKAPQFLRLSPVNFASTARKVFIGT